MSDRLDTYALRLPGIAVAVTVGAWTAPATAQQTIPIPMFSACMQTDVPALPARWRAVGLMIPFQRQQLTVGEFIYDGTLPAIRTTVYGLESGAADLLITATETYRLTGPHNSPGGCTAIGGKFTPPSNSWLPKEAVCVGETPLGGIPMQWWKTAAPDGRNKWHLYKTANRLPWRTIFPAPSNDPAVIGEYAITYFPAFAPLAETNLTQLRDLCVTKAKKADAVEAAAKTVRDLMAIPDAVSEAERMKRIQTLIPGLSHQACSRTPPTRWPNQFFTTATISPISYQWSPYPSVVYYDWDGHATQVAVMHQTRAPPLVPELISVLKNGIGYSLERLPNGSAVCMASNPGLVRPDWMTAAGCECKGVIERNPDFGSDETSQILACPVKETNRVNWAWYTTQGRPILFMEPAAYGNGVNIADYHLWLPGQKLPPIDFQLPGECANPVGAGVPASAMNSCSDCHTIPK